MFTRTAGNWDSPSSTQPGEPHLTSGAPGYTGLAYYYRNGMEPEDRNIKERSPLRPFVSRVLVDLSWSYNSSWVSSVRVKSCPTFRKPHSRQTEQRDMSQHRSCTGSVIRKYVRQKLLGDGWRDLWSLYSHNLKGISCSFKPQRHLLKTPIISCNSIDYWPETTVAFTQQPLHSTSLHFPQTSLSRRREERERVLKKR